MQQAQRDLRALVTARILEPVGRSRAGYYTVGIRFPDSALKVARTLMCLVDPFAG
ncbi:hypothetical protein [Kitasatospora sp. NPDC057738]|uniref:hypothetical protein n=1 Tax=Kitasatospora sp. NPDC057738 TaxID=3346233 RepID=UPI0036CF20C4